MTETTTRLEPTTLRDVLQVYTIHQTGEDIATETSNDTRDFVSQPDWPSDRRRIPPYRSTTRTYPLSERPGGVTTFEGVIVVVMFSGVYTVAVRTIHALC